MRPKVLCIHYIVCHPHLGPIVCHHPIMCHCHCPYVPLPLASPLAAASICHCHHPLWPMQHHWPQPPMLPLALMQHLATPPVLATTPPSAHLPAAAWILADMKSRLTIMIQQLTHCLMLGTCSHGLLISPTSMALHSRVGSFSSAVLWSVWARESQHMEARDVCNEHKCGGCSGVRVGCR